MPPDPLDSRSSLDRAPGNKLQRRDSSRRRRAGAEAAAAAAASASVLAAEEEQRRHHERGGRDSDTPTRQPRKTTVKVTLHDDRVNLRRLTEEEAAMSRREQRRRRGDSASSISGTETPSRRYRRDSSQKPPESGTGMTADADSALSPPNPAFAGDTRRPKDSAYYSGAAGRSAITPPHYGQPVSSMGSDSHGTWSEAMSPSPGDRPGGSAAENRRRRRQQRQTSLSTRPVAGNDMFD